MCGEAEDANCAHLKPLKYPTIFNSADVAVVTEMDLAAALEFSWDTA
jgi:hydrogenase nickel incorporation protein HypB